MRKNLICYCFGYSEGEIIRDVEENRGTSAIMEKILSQKKKGACNCNYHHPEGR